MRRSKRQLGCPPWQSKQFKSYASNADRIFLLSFRGEGLNGDFPVEHLPAIRDEIAAFLCAAQGMLRSRLQLPFGAISRMRDRLPNREMREFSSGIPFHSGCHPRCKTLEVDRYPG
jgi:hypothetical protein